MLWLNIKWFAGDLLNTGCLLRHICTHSFLFFIIISRRLPSLHSYIFQSSFISPLYPLTIHHLTDIISFKLFSLPQLFCFSSPHCGFYYFCLKTSCSARNSLVHKSDISIIKLLIYLSYWFYYYITIPLCSPLFYPFLSVLFNYLPISFKWTPLSLCVPLFLSWISAP